MEELYEGHGYRLTMESAANPNGVVKEAVRVYCPDRAHIIALTNDDKILMLEEYRPFYKEYEWTLPSGRMNKDEDVDKGAQRELQEETGFRANDLRLFCTCNHSERHSFTNYVYIGKDLVEDPLPQDEHEYIKLHKLTLDEAIERVLESPHVHTPSAYALLRYQREYGS